MSGPAFDLSDLYQSPQGPVDLAHILGGDQSLHAEYRSGALAKRMAAANQRDQQNLQDEQASTPGYLTQIAQRAAGGLLSDAQGMVPVVEAGEAYLGSLGSHIPGLTPDTGPINYSQSLDALRGQTNQIPAVAKYAGQAAAGGLALGGNKIGELLLKHPVIGSALYGAATGAGSATPNTPLARARETGVGGLVGGAFGIVPGLAGRIAQRTGAVDAIGRLLQRMGGPAKDVSQAIGTEGAANALLADRQAILNGAPGANKSAAQTMLDHVTKLKTNADELYRRARQGDQTIFADPSVRSIITNPELRPYFEQARAVLRNGDNPVEISPAIAGQPRLAANPQAPIPEVPSGAPQSTREAIDAFQNRAAAAQARTQGTTTQQMARAALERRAAYNSLPSVSGIVGATAQEPIAAQTAQVLDVPTPEEVALVKRTFDDIANSKFQQPGMSPLQARNFANHADDLRNSLHRLSPQWAEADRYTSLGKNFQDAFTRAYGAQRRVTTSGLNPAKGKSTEAIDAWIQSAKDRGTGTARLLGQQAGAAGAINEQLANTPLGTTAGEGLSGVLDPFNPAAASVRRPAFGSDQEAQDFAAMLGKMAAKSGGEQSPFHGYGVASIPGIPAHVMYRSPFGNKNPLATEAGAALRARLSTLLTNQAGRQEIAQRLAAASRGRALLDPLEQMMMGGTGGLLSGVGGHAMNGTGNP